ncbi:unnamed protein product [Calypogeia fissa]
MPELSKDFFGDAMARAFFLRESPFDHHHVDHLNQNHHIHHQPFYYGSSYAPVMVKPSHQERQKSLGMATHPPLTLSDPDAFLRHVTSFLPLDIDAACHQPQQQPVQHQQHLQQSVGGFSSYALPHYQPLQLEVPEIEECSTWMSDVLDDFPSISTPELPPLVSPGSSSFDSISAADFPCPTTIRLPPVQQLQPQKPPQQHTAIPPSCLEDDSAAPPPQPTTPPTTVKSSQGVSSPKASIITDDVSSLSRTPKTLKPRGSKRCQRAIEKQKKVANVEQLEHVRRERQRRDDMSFKISTLECLLPPAGPNLKRDRASIVHDSVHYVKSLQQKVEELKKTLAELKLKKSVRAAPRTDAIKVENPEIAASLNEAQFVEYHIQVEGEGEAAARLEKCRCRPDFMSGAMKVLEHLNLDVCRCTITKMFDYTMCVIIVKPRLTSNQVVTSASVVSAFRSSLQAL